jgi:hypothetical protein
MDHRVRAVLMVFIVCLSQAPTTSSYSVLMHPCPWKSRLFDVVKIGKELAWRGHSVSILTPQHLLLRAEDYLERTAVVPSQVIGETDRESALLQAADASGREAIGLCKKLRVLSNVHICCVRCRASWEVGPQSSCHMHSITTKQHFWLQSSESHLSPS